MKLLFLLLFTSSIFATDNLENVIFKDLSYPIEKNIDINEKDGIIFYETPYSEVSSYAYNLIVIQGETENLNINLEIWLKDSTVPGIKYNIIKPLNLKFYKNGRFWAKFKLKTPTKEPFKLVFINTTSINKNFKIILYEIQALIEPEHKTSKEFIYNPDPSLSVPDNLIFKIIKRKDWQAVDPKEEYTIHQPQAITIHHTAGKYTNNIEESLNEIQFIQDYHQNAKGWIDIGYHFLIDSQGNIFEGRPLKVVGAHVAGKNTNNIGISVMGNYHPPKNDMVSTNTINSIITLSSYLSIAYNIEKSSFYAHRDLGPTDCPGDLLYSKMDYLKTSIFIPQTIPVPGIVDKKEIKNPIFNILNQKVFNN